MKSLASLNILYQTHCSNCMPAITQSEKELWDGIENDLKVLESLKELISKFRIKPEHDNVLQVMFYITEYHKDFKLIKEWLENDC